MERVKRKMVKSTSSAREKRTQVEIRGNTEDQLIALALDSLGAENFELLQDQGTVSVQTRASVVYEIAYQVFYPAHCNPDDLCPIVVLHGGPGLSSKYCITMKSLACFPSKKRYAGYKVIFFDQLGSGMSSWPSLAEEPQLANMAFHAEVVNCVIQELVPNRQSFHLLGQSGGGFLALEYVIRHSPKNCKSLILANTAPSYALFRRDVTEEVIPRLPMIYAKTLLADNPREMPLYDQAKQRFMSTFFLVTDPPPSFVRDDFAEMNLELYHATMGEEAFLVSNGTVRNWTVEDRLKEIKIPTFAFIGENDQFGTGGLRAFQKHIPKCKIEIIPDATHMAHVDYLDRFLNTVAIWLEGDFHERRRTYTGSFFSK